MNKLIQKSKYITVQDFLPEWTKFVENHHTIMMLHQSQNQYGLEIGHGESCLVGEAHGFNDIYHVTCEMCSDLSVGDLEINGIDYVSALNNLKNFYTFKEGLYKHFMSFHKDQLLIDRLNT